MEPPKLPIQSLPESYVSPFRNKAELAEQHRERQVAQADMLINLLQRFGGIALASSEKAPEGIQEILDLLQHAEGSFKSRAQVLSTEQVSRMEVLLGEEGWRAFLSLGEEAQSELFNEGLLNLGRRFKNDGNDTSAALLFAFLSQSDFAAEIRTAAEAELSALTGEGKSAFRSEFWLGHLAKEAANYRTLLPLMGATVVSSVFRAGILSRLEANAMARAWRARALAGGLSWMAEVSAYTLLSREFSAGPSRPLSEDLASAGITLGAFKLCGWLGNQAFLKAQSLSELALPNALSGFQKFHQIFFTQSTLFTGLLASQALETSVGLRKPASQNNLLLDTFGSLLSLNISTALGQEALGAKFAGLERELAVRTKIFTQFGSLSPKAAQASRKRALTYMNPIFSPMWMAMGSGGIGGGGSDHDTIPSLRPPEDFIPPSSGSATLSRIEVLKNALVEAEGDPARLLHLTTSLMHLAFSGHAQPEIQRAAGRTLFKEGYFSRWQEILMEREKPELLRLAALPDMVLKDLAPKFLRSLEEMVRIRDDIGATRMIGPMVYAAFRAKDPAVRTAFEAFMIQNPNPAFRLAAMINQYPKIQGVNFPGVLWKHYERILAFDDLFSTNANRRSFGRAMIRQIHKTELENSLQTGVLKEIVEAFDRPEKLAEINKILNPERAITLSGSEGQVKYFLSRPLMDLSEPLRNRVIRELSEELFAQAQALGFEGLRAHFIAEGAILPGASPMKLLPDIMTRKLRSLVQERKINPELGKDLVAAYKKLFKLLDVQMQWSNSTPDGYLSFIDPFAN